MKSNVSDYLELVESVYIDATTRCPADVSDLRDLKTIRSRVKEEGLSFLTITLPNFCKAFEKALAVGRIDPTWRKTEFRGFPFHGAIPAFLQGMLGLIFDQGNGSIYDENVSSIDLTTVIDGIRQICLTFKKVELPCTSSRTQAAIDGFIAIEQSFNEFKLTDLDTAEFLAVSSVLWDNTIYRLRDSVLFPRHGPGATAERISGNQKYVWKCWYERLDNCFSFFDMAYVNSAMESEEVKGVLFVPKEQELPVRVTPVPKTLKGPRIIAIEPVCMQYAQQGLRSLLYDAIESAPLSRGHVNFRDQSINQRMAVSASRTGQFATIDLSEASDRVPRDLALEMFRAYPDFRDAVDACRSTHAELPDGRIIGPLGKFASMGSALCFPVESMYFYTICVAALLRGLQLPCTFANVLHVTRGVYVYGDDIIVPTDQAGIVLDYLQKYNCKVNSSKTFTSGSFRESCGVDAYCGKPVTPIYVRQQRPKSKQQVRELVSWSATANLFYLKGYYRTAEHMHSKCASILKFYPEIAENSSGLGRIYRWGSKNDIRSSPRYHRPEVRAWVPSPVYRADPLGGYGALTKSLLRLETAKDTVDHRQYTLVELARLDLFGGLSDPAHLERSALYGAVSLKLRWVPSS